MNTRFLQELEPIRLESNRNLVIKNPIRAKLAGKPLPSGSSPKAKFFSHRSDALRELPPVVAEKYLGHTMLNASDQKLFP